MADPKSPVTVIECPDCHGQGEIVTRHRDYGAYWCPEPTEAVACRSCGGQGAIAIPKAA